MPDEALLQKIHDELVSLNRTMASFERSVRGIETLLSSGAGDVREIRDNVNEIQQQQMYRNLTGDGGGG